MKKEHTTKKIAFGTLKGGAAKTMNAFSIAGILAEKYKVLLIDMDPQCNLTANCGISITDRDAYSVRYIYENTPKNQPDPSLLIVESPIEELPKLDVMPSSIVLFKTEKLLAQKSDKERILSRYMEKHSEFFEKYDYVIFDTNPSMSTVNINTFLMADSIVLCTDTSDNGLMGAEIFCELWDETREELGMDKDNIAALIIGNIDERSNFAKQLKEYAKKNEEYSAQELVLNSVIHTTVKLKETEKEHKPINVLYPKHNACLEYREVVKELKKEGIV